MFSTATRVEEHTAPYLNLEIDQNTRQRIDFYRSQSSERIGQRLEELDWEWDVERTLQTNFAIFSTIGALLTAQVSRRWGWLALGVPAFMEQHAIQGWCPPLAALRRLGFRTANEISEERFALKSLRGDFDQVADSSDPEEILRAVDK